MAGHVFAFISPYYPSAVGDGHYSSAAADRTSVDIWLWHGARAQLVLHLRAGVLAERLHRGRVRTAEAPQALIDQAWEHHKRHSANQQGEHHAGREG